MRCVYLSLKMGKAETEQQGARATPSILQGRGGSHHNPASDSARRLMKQYSIHMVIGGSVVNNPPASAGDAGDSGSIPGSGRSPGVGNGNPL